MNIIQKSWPLLFLIVILTGCTQIPEKLSSDNGEVEWDSNINLAILNGEWKLFENALLTPQQINQEIIEKGKNAIIPSYWDEGVNYGTYYLQVTVDDNKVGKPIGLRIPKVYTAYKLWINEKLERESGYVATTKRETIPLGKTDIIYFSSTSEKIEIVLQISSFHHRKAGISGPVMIGETESVQNINMVEMTITWFTLGALSILAIIQFLFYIHRRKNKIHLYIGLFSGLIGFRTLLKGNMDIFFLWKDISWLTVVRLDYIIIFASTSLFSLYLSMYFPRYRKKIITSVTTIITNICITIIIFTEPLFFTKLMIVFYLLLALNALYFLYLVVKGIKNQAEGAKVIGSMFLVLLATVILDILYNNILVNTTVQTTSIGLIIFFAGQSFVETKKYVIALEQEAKLSQEIENTNREVIVLLGEITETRSKETGNHVRRVAEYSYLLARKYGLSHEESEIIRVASPLHDIGKVAIPDEILNKPAKLTAEEFEVMKKHTLIGHQMLKYSERKLIQVAAEIAYTHHEKYNGQGYPRGLKASEIPLTGRITAVADVFDALSNDRIYKRAWDIEKIKVHFENEQGKHFDPILAEIFLEHIDEFENINRVFKDR